MLKKILLATISALMLNSASAGPITSNENSPAVWGGALDVKAHWNPKKDEVNTWITATLDGFAPWYVDVNGAQVVDIALGLPNSGKNQDWSFKLFLDGQEVAADPTNTSYRSYYNDVSLSDGVHYFTLSVMNATANAANENFTFLNRDGTPIVDEVTDPTANVPEPASLALLGAGLLGLAALRRRKV